MCYRNQGTRISGDELKPWAALLCSMALDGKKSAFLHSRAPSPEKGMQESRAMLSNLLKWCFNRPIPARSPHSGANVNPRMGVQDQGFISQSPVDRFLQSAMCWNSPRYLT